MSLSVHVLGTSSARPTTQRGVSALAIVNEGQTLLIDCGEGTQRQMLRHGVALDCSGILLTHLHADHTLGIPGLLRTMGMEGRTEPLPLWGPPGTARLAREAVHLLVDGLPFRLSTTELRPGDQPCCAGCEVRPFRVRHRGVTYGYAIREPIGQRLIVVSGDTRPCESTVEAARGADLLVHEATFIDDEAERARETGHSTAREAAEVARQAGVSRLLLTHFSARFSHDTRVVVEQARSVFESTIAARDGFVVRFPPLQDADEVSDPVAAPESADDRNSSRD